MGNTEKVILTPDGLRKLQEELERRKTVDKPRISVRIKEAIEGGDISESGEYEEAKRDQSFNEGRIRELEAILANAEQLDPSKMTAGVVGLGSRVTVEEKGRTETYLLVNQAEAGRGQNGEIRVSTVSPVGKSLLGRKLGDTVEVSLPSNKLALKIVSIE